MSLYQIDQEYLKYIDPETGEITDEEAFLKLMYERENAIEELALLHKNFISEEKALKEEAEILKQRACKKHTKAETIARQLQKALDGVSFESSKALISFRRSEGINILNEDAIPFEYMCTKQEVAPDKMKIKAAIKSGEMVPGAALVESLNISIK